MTIETIRLSESTKRRLINLKRLTGIGQWNILSRWALCVSLAESPEPPGREEEPMSSIEMTWKVFAGHNGGIYLAMVLNQYALARESGFQQSVSEFARLHIERGVATLANKLGNKKLSTLIELAINAA